MIVKYERGQPGAIELRIEAHVKTAWDDIQLRFADGTSQWWQLKRLTVAIDRKDVAPLIQEAAKGSNLVSFWFGVATLVDLAGSPKPGCSLQHLQELCVDSRQNGLVAADYVAALTGGQANAYAFLEDALATANPQEVMLALRRVHIVRLGLEQELKDATEQELGGVFSNPAALADALFNWLIQRPEGAISVTPSLLYDEVVEKIGQRNPGSPPWCHLTFNTSTFEWELRGLLNLADAVKQAWDPKQPITIKIAGLPPPSDETTTQIARLMLHRAPLTAIEASEANAWQKVSESLCGGTLGASCNAPDLQCTPLTFGASQPAKETKPGALHSELNQGMNKALWEAVQESVATRLGDGKIIAQDLRTPMVAIWKGWLSGFLKIENQRMWFLSAMLATTHESQRKDFAVSVRTGRNLADALATGIIYALSVAASLSPAGQHATLKDDGGGLSQLELSSVRAHIIALSAASHHRDRAVGFFDDAPDMLFEEPGLTILSAVRSSAEELYRVAREEQIPFSSSEIDSAVYIRTGRPFPVLTASPTFTHALRTGMKTMRQHLADSLRKMNDDRFNAVTEAAAKDI